MPTLVERLRLLASDADVVEADKIARTMREAAAKIERLQSDIARCRPLLCLLTVEQIIDGGDAAIEASGLNPWCMSEGLATGDERISPTWLEVDDENG